MNKPPPLPILAGDNKEFVHGPKVTIRATPSCRDRDQGRQRARRADSGPVHPDLSRCNLVKTQAAHSFLKGGALPPNNGEGLEPFWTGADATCPKGARVLGEHPSQSAGQGTAKKCPREDVPTFLDSPFSSPWHAASARRRCLRAFSFPVTVAAPYMARESIRTALSRRIHPGVALRSRKLLFLPRSCIAPNCLFIRTP